MKNFYNTFKGYSRFLVLFTILSLAGISLQAQTLTISNTGQTGTSGSNWSISGNTLTVSGGNANIRASVIENALAVSDLTVNAIDINVNENIISNSGNALSLIARGTIELSASINTSGANGDILLQGETSIGISGSDRTINSGSGDVTIITNNVDHTGQDIIFNSTGRLTIAPFSNWTSEFLAGQYYNLTGVLNDNGHFIGSNNIETRWYQINNFSSLKGLTLGRDGSNNGIAIDVVVDISGPLFFYGGDVLINNDLNTTSAGADGDILIKGTKSVLFRETKNITTDGSDVIVWADSDADDEGHIAIGNDVIFNTVNGSTASGLNSGGNIVLAGGADDGSNGGTASDGIPDGFARSASNPGIELSTDNSGDVNFYSGGGAIVLHGYSSNNESPNVINNAGIQQWGGLFINAGTGRIRMLGESVNYYGIHLNHTSTASQLNLELISAATTGDAIFLRGLSDNNRGIVFNYSSNKELKATAGGDITIEGVGGGSNLGLFLQRVDILANTGTITLDGGINGISNRNTGNTYGFKAGSAITSSSSDIILKGDALSFNIGDIDTVFNTSGSVTLEPSGTSFSSALTFPIRNVTLSSEVSGITLGKTGNIADITIASETTVAGPISVYGNKIDVDAALTSTATSGSGISLNGQRIIQDAGIDATTSGADISYIASGYVAEGNAERPIVLEGDGTNRAILNANGGNITVSSSFATGGVAGSTARAVGFSTADLVTSGSGTISLTADATNNPNTGASAWGMQPNNARIISESGAITLEMTGGASSSNSRGLALDGQSLQVLSESGTIKIIDHKPVGLTGNYAGTYLRPSGNNAIIVGADGTEVASSSSDIIIETDRIAFVDRTTAFTTSGKLSLRPISASFIAGLSTSLINLSPSATGLTLGKAGNTADVTVARATTIAGPISVYGGTITLDADLITTNNGDISLYSDNALGGLSASRTLTAAGAFKYIPNSISFTSDVTYPIVNLTATSAGLTIGKTTNDKNITINMDVAGNAGIELFGNEININANLKTTSSADLKLKGNTTIAAGKYIASNGNFIHDGDLVFLSDASNGDAYLGAVDGNYSKVSGDVIVQKYYQGKRAFRFVASSVNGGSIFDNWQNKGLETSGFGTHITGTSGTVGEFDATTGFDYTASGNPSLFGFNSANGWEAISNTKTTNLEVGKPYRLFVRGDRDIDLSNNLAASATTLVTTGALQVGDKTISFPSTPDQNNPTNYAFIANPYQSRIDVGKVLDANSNSNTSLLWVWDPMVNTRGSYVLVDQLSGNGTTTPSASNATKFVEPGQAFFILTNDANPSISFTESMKDVTTDVSVAPESFDNQSEIILNLRDQNQSVIDGLRVRFNAQYDSKVDELDITKMWNIDENLASENEGNLFTIQHRSMPIDDEVIPLFTNNWRNKKYSFEVNLKNLNDVTVFLKDNYLNTQTLLSDRNSYDFEVDATVEESKSIDRFELVFKNSTLSIGDEKSDKYRLWPNPAKSIVNLSFKSDDIVRTNIRLYNNLGQQVYEVQQSNQSSNVQLDVRSLHAGVYIIVVEDATGQRFIEKLIKQ